MAAALERKAAAARADAAGAAETVARLSAGVASATALGNAAEDPLAADGNELVAWPMPEHPLIRGAHTKSSAKTEVDRIGSSLPKNVRGPRNTGGVVAG